MRRTVVALFVTVMDHIIAQRLGRLCSRKMNWRYSELLEGDGEARL